MSQTTNEGNANLIEFVGSEPLRHHPVLRTRGPAKRIAMHRFNDLLTVNLVSSTKQIDRKQHKLTTRHLPRGVR